MTTQANRPGALGLALATGLCAFGAYQTWPLLQSSFFPIPALLALSTITTSLRLLATLTGYGLTGLQRRSARRRSTNHGSARWAEWKDIRRDVKRGNAPFWGLFNGRPLFIEYESSALTVAPAGMGKTTCTVIPAVFSRPKDMAAIVFDSKSEISCSTKRPVEKKLKQKTLTLNPGGLNEKILGRTSRYNPLHRLVDALEDPRGPVDFMAGASAMALQLHPEPKEQGENIFFRNGSRKLLVFVFIVLVLEFGRKATLTMALSLLRDMSRLKDELYKASFSTELNGELADRAKDLLAKLEGGGDGKQFDSFREGATQALEIFSPSGLLAECVSDSDFRFADLKEDPKTVYVISDPTRAAVFAPWLGLIAWCAATELMRCMSHKPVLMLLDEATSFRVEGINELLVRGRGYGIRLHVVLQEPDDWARVYSKESLSILLSQTEIQQWFGSRSNETLKMLSERLGDTTVKTETHNLGRHLSERVQPTLGEAARKLMTSSEIAQMKGKSILLVRDLPPIVSDLVGVHEVDPWKYWADINPLHGKKHIGRTKLKL